MTTERAITDHYLHGDLLHAIQASLGKLGKTTADITIEDLAPVDEIHIGGRQATENWLNQLDFSGQKHILDLGCGLGGAARFVTHRYDNRVTGIDLTEEFVETGKSLCAWVKLDKQVGLRQGSATEMPFQDDTFDGGYMLHVGMNIEDKERLFRQVYRVLRRGSAFGVYDIMRIHEGDLTYPVPWAADKTTSSLATPERYQQALVDAGFDISATNNRRDFALETFRQQSEKTAAGGGPPPLGLHVLMKESTATRVRNMVDGIARAYMAPVEIIARKH